MQNPKFEAFRREIRQVLIDQYEADAALKAEFLSGDDYAAYTLATAGKALMADWEHRFMVEDGETALRQAETARPAFH